ncbi:LON peptidase substrate-binding domain-containing protein [Maricaulis sp.]|uniref:LON peptidase substrate-binding domain-containing protein n=1 Tax=Maricaulis sp. TaxID=1486257 RepID=UPI00260805F9|nr:LON peptidase substrate-binding domain-containing protein [Maricaulis sp.]
MSSATHPPTDLPLFPLGGTILLPGERLPLNVFEPRYLNMIDDVRRGPGHIGIIQIRPGGTPEKPTLAGIGGAGRVDHFEETGDGRYLITLTGVSRFVMVEELERATPYRVARADYAPFAHDLEPRSEIEGDRDRLVRMLQAWFQNEHVAADWESVAEAPLTTLVDQLSMVAPFGAQDRQRLLEAADTAARLGEMEAILAERLAGGADGPVQ